MATLNRAELIGFVGTDPDVRFVTDTSGVGQTKVAAFRVATKEGDRTTWHNIVCWAKRADFVEKYVAKSASVYVSGAIRFREWKDNGGKDCSRMEIVADNVQLLSSARQRTGSISAQTAAQLAAETGFHDDLPF